MGVAWERRGTVCDDGFGMNEGHAACKTLGHAGAASVSHVGAQSTYSCKSLLYNILYGNPQTYGTFFILAPSGYPIIMDDVDCESNVDNLASCSSRSSSHNCGHHEDVLLDCYQDGITRSITITGYSGVIRHQTYGNDADFRWRMTPSCNTVKILSTAFETENCCDYVTIAGVVFRFFLNTRYAVLLTEVRVIPSKLFCKTKCTIYLSIL